MIAIPRATLRPDDRGQTSFDFAVGMGVFLITLGFVFSFAPGMFMPFTEDTGANMGAATRGAARLAEDALVEDPTVPGVLNTSCTAEFFNPANLGYVCRFDTSRAAHAVMGLDDATGLNVSITDGGSVRSITVDGTTTRLAVGPPPSTSRGVITAQRLIRLDGETSRLVVRVW